jgi:2-amino-4-hydroxy-6-hydroxymethyldihydropteridine diphosphokinase
MILIALGSNLPFADKQPPEVVQAALAALGREGIVIEARSRLYSTAAWPDPTQPRYVNAVACVRTPLDPSSLMERLHRIEQEFGRVRGARNASRTLDLDLIDYDGRIMKGELRLPHPRLGSRGFVLKPLAEVAPDWRHPETGETVTALIAALPPQDVRLI